MCTRTALLRRKMYILIGQLFAMSFITCLAEEGKRHGPIFEEQPIDTIYPEESLEGKVSMNCRARANPPPTYKWKLNNWDIDLLNKRYILIGGNLVINKPDKNIDTGKYVCTASNPYGTIRSNEASLQFGYLDPFSPEERYAVSVKEGIGAVLLCDPPPHYPDDLVYHWLLNDFPTFVVIDKRRFVSQTNGNLYISKVEQSDKGNYSCLVQSPSITKSVFSKFIPLIPLSPQSETVRRIPADIKVQFKDIYALKGQNVTLECFALGNPVPVLRWQKVNEPMPPTAEMSMSNSLLTIFNIQQEDEGTYECQAENIKGRDSHQARVYVQALPEWVEHINDTERDIGSDIYWPCVATGKPLPTIRWLKNGLSYHKGELRIYSLTLEDAGMYQCIAENKYGTLSANAELKILALPPNFELNPMKKRILAAKGGRVIIECKPKAAPKPKISWSKGTELLTNNSRISIWYDGSLEILNITKLDEGSYTCFAENDRGKANSTGTLSVTAATKIILAPSNVDVTVGENTTMQCHASRDPSLDLTFIWSQNGHIIDFARDSEHYERNFKIEGGGELFIKNVQLRHSGRYICTAQTIVDNSSASAELVVRGPPGPPGGVRLEDIKDTSLVITWSSGTDNHQPISKYTIQSKNTLSEEWKDAKTDPKNIEGNMERAKVIDLIPWMEYEFRVIATNTLGIGEPSIPSSKIKTEGAAPNVAPSDVGGGGGSNGELTITWTPLPREYYYGNNFGYIVAFKPYMDKDWRKVTVPNTEMGRYVHKDDTMTPSTEYQVKVKAYNNKGDGPFSLTAVIYSAKDVPTDPPAGITTKVLSSSEVLVSWQPVFGQSVEGYQVRYWRIQDKEPAANRVLVTNLETSVKLEGMLPDTTYHIEVRAINSAGDGPRSRIVDVVTKKAPPSQKPKITSSVRSGSEYIITWEHVVPLSNESKVEGYKVLYRPDGQVKGELFETGQHKITLPVPAIGEYIVEVRAHSEGGDGEVAQVKISGATIGASPGLLGLLLPTLGLLFYLEF